MLHLSWIALALAAGQAIESHPQICGGAPQNWSALPIVPANSRDLPVNVAEITADGRLLWNHIAVTELQASEYLGLMPGFPGKSLMVLRVRQGADCTQVKRVRELIEAKLKCDAESCGEFDG
jgi:hypothetical protein